MWIELFVRDHSRKLETGGGGMTTTVPFFALFPLLSSSTCILRPRRELELVKILITREKEILSNASL